MESVLGPAVGGALAIVAGFVGAWVALRGESQHRRRELQIRMGSDALAALQGFLREITTIAYTKTDAGGLKLGPSTAIDGLTLRATFQIPDVEATPRGFYEAVTRWNSARLQVLLAGSPDLVESVRLLDQEVDRLLDLAIIDQWSRQSFRRERVRIGELMADFANLVRSNSGYSPLIAKTVWSWAEVVAPDEATQPRSP